MAVKRSGWNLMIGLGLMTLPACLFVRPPITERPRLATRPASPRSGQTVFTGSSDFASLIRVPGERISTAASSPAAAINPLSPASPPPMPTLATTAPPQDNPPSLTGLPEPDNAVTTVTGSSPSPTMPRGLPLLKPISEVPAPEQPLVAAVRAYLNNQPERAVSHLNALDPPNQELMLQLIPAVVQASRLDLQRSGPTELGILADQLRETADRLASRAPLVLDRVCFCRRVKNFGRYDPLPVDHRFQRGGLAELYVEVRNAPSVATSDPQQGEGYLTRLACTLQIFDASGAVVPITDRNLNRVPALTETKIDFTRSPIRDYFLLFRFPVPDRPGNYVVSIKVHDPAGGREVSQTLPNLRVQ